MKGLMKFILINAYLSLFSIELFYYKFLRIERKKGKSAKFNFQNFKLDENSKKLKLMRA